MERKEKIDMAAHAISRLSEMQDDFMNELKHSKNHQPYPAGALIINNDQIQASVFSVTLSLSSRIVCIENQPKAIEYLFVTELKGEDLVILKFYLHSNYAITRDITVESKICDYNNDYLGKYLVYEIAENLLSSPIFEP